MARIRPGLSGGHARFAGLVALHPVTSMGEPNSSEEFAAATGRTNDAFDEKGCIVSRPEQYKVISHAPCGCKRYADGTKYECLTHRYTYSGCQA